ncbi:MULTISPECIES: AAA family ATPase [Clostridium]|jgi:hypothetical protein|uniref:AAA family ATPase n=1 Tax=Clostridium TaxID=1485 RepID=UPI00242F4AD7|nr:hypothetical protein [Clostridium tyrobutyricum]
MINRIVLLNSIAGCGKDTSADYICSNYSFKKVALADGIKEIAKKYFNSTYKNRELYIKIGEKMREINPNVWIDYTLKRTDNIEKCIISDCRQPREYYRLVNKGFLPIRILCDKDKAIDRLRKRDGHCDESLLELPTEIGTNKLNAIEIDNNGRFKDLYDKLDNLINQNYDNYLSGLQLDIKLNENIKK